MEVDVVEGEEDEGDFVGAIENNLPTNRRPGGPPKGKRTLLCWTCGKVGHPYRLCRSGLPPLGKCPPPRRPATAALAEDRPGNEEA